MTFKTYLVGGAVRDALMGEPQSDRDWVVVGAHPQQLLDLGFSPIGRDFPVFLHPQTHEEFALARTERKTGAGYHGFVFHADASVTLEQDLLRRDLTINAMALDVAATSISHPGRSPVFSSPSEGLTPSDRSGGAVIDLPNTALIDPYGGQQDLQNRVLRHVSPAFAEDPVRLLRLARFAARWPDFVIAPETLDLLCDMVHSGEVDTLVPERVWAELARALMTARPSRFFEVLRQCGALQKLLPELDKLWGVPQRAEYHPEIDTGVHVMMVMDMSAQLNAPLPVRWACLMHDLGKGSTPADVLPRHIGHEQRSVRLLRKVCQRLRAPSDCKELAEVVASEHGNIHRSEALNAAAIMRLLERCDALRRPERFAQALLACECDARGRLGFADTPYPARPRLLQALQWAQSADACAAASQAAAQGKQGADIGVAVQAARCKAIAQGLHALAPSENFSSMNSAQNHASGRSLIREVFTPAELNPEQQIHATRLLRLLLAQDGSTTLLCETLSGGPVELQVLSQQAISDPPPVVRSSLPGKRYLERITSLIAHDGEVMMDNLCYVALEGLAEDIRSELEAGVMPVGHLLQRLWVRRAPLVPNNTDWVHKLWNETGLPDASATRSYQIITPEGALMVIAETYRRGMWRR